MADPVTITHVEAWQRAAWGDLYPPRPAWLVTCADHPDVGKDSDGSPWGYALEQSARSVATRHRKAYHHD